MRIGALPPLKHLQEKLTRAPRLFTKVDQFQLFSWIMQDQKHLLMLPHVFLLLVLLLQQVPILEQGSLLLFLVAGLSLEVPVGIFLQEVVLQAYMPAFRGNAEFGLVILLG